MEVDVSMRIVLLVRNGSIVSFRMSMAAFQLLCWSFVWRHGCVATDSSDSFPRGCTNWPLLSQHKLIHPLVGFVCEILVSSTGLVCEDRETR